MGGNQDPLATIAIAIVVLGIAGYVFFIIYRFIKESIWGRFVGIECPKCGTAKAYKMTRKWNEPAGIATKLVGHTTNGNPIHETTETGTTIVVWDCSSCNHHDEQRRSYSSTNRSS